MPVFIITCILMASLLCLAIVVAYRFPLTKWLFLCPMVCSFILTIGYTIWAYHDFCTSLNGRPGICLLLLPFDSIAVAVAGFSVSWSCLYVPRFVVERIRGIPVGFTSIALLVLAIVLLALTGYVVQNMVGGP